MASGFPVIYIPSLRRCSTQCEWVNKDFFSLNRWSNLCVTQSHTATAPHFNPEFSVRSLPRNISIIPEIKRFLPPTRDIQTSQIELIDGTVRFSFLTMNRLTLSYRSLPASIPSYLRQVSSILFRFFHSTTTHLFEIMRLGPHIDSDKPIDV